MYETIKTLHEQSKTITQTEKRKDRPSKVLVVEDDMTFEPLWTSIIKKADHDAEIVWSISEVEAERLIVDSIKKGHPFDLVITDIFLSGSTTGIDLWTKFFKKLHGKIIVTSGIEFQKFIQFFSKEAVRPMYLQKPLIAHECIGAVYGALHENF